MEGQGTLGFGAPRVHGQRGLSTIISVILMVVILALVGVGTYALMGGFAAVPPRTCSPPNSPGCQALGFANLHDVTLLVPLRSAQQGASIPITASLPSGESSPRYVFNFGDGPSVTSATPTITHSYSTPGIYLVYAQASVGGVPHDNLHGIATIAVSASFGANTLGNLPSVTGVLVSNTSTPATVKGATAVLQAGQSITVTGTYSAQPTNPAFTLKPPKFAANSTVQLSTTQSTNTSQTVKAVFPTAGSYDLSFVGSASNGNLTAYQNYTWSVYVAASGSHAAVIGTTIAHSPHPGTIINYELAPGGGLSEDPAIDYETVGAEPIFNVYQTLIAYNGSNVGPTPNNYIPVLATCVPGSPQCQQLYGASHPLVNGTDYTFVITSNASFYDPATHSSWGVYPSDIVFSMARTLGFSTLPCVTCNNGWIIGQSLLNTGNGTWSLIHSTYNNTPDNILKSMTINETGACPAIALTQDHGCVTFHAYGAHHTWAYFLELIADPLGGSIVPCGWFSSNNQGAGIPYWTAGNVTDAGDHPCGVPGAPGYGSSNIPVTGWDHWEQLGSGAFGTYLGHVQYAMVGSGPYYLAQYSVGLSYTLAANPSYKSNPYCTWGGCYPAPHQYAPNVQVTWEKDPTAGEQAYASGVADHASIPSTDFALLLQLVQQGRVQVISAPTLTVGFYAFNMNFNLGGAQHFDTSPVTVKNDFFSYLGMRQFVSRAYPYTTIQQSIETKDGIQLGFNYGGAIPEFMANYYPKDIAWPNADPCSSQTDVACPAYWWHAMLDSTSPYFDPEASSCIAANPCQLPLFGETGSPAGDQIRSLWASSISQFSNGGVKVSPVDINFIDLLIQSSQAPGNNAMPFFGLGWAPDYPDPTDYVVPMYSANATYTYGNAVAQSLFTPQFSTGCTHGIYDYNYSANNSFPQSCQGVAYKAMLRALGIASTAPAGPGRVLLYDLAEKIAAQLALYTYTSQSNQVSSAAAWMDTSSLNTNVTIGGGGDNTFFWMTGNSVQFAGST
jgi:peptide/nickel transport system substrate-binding protein